MDSPAVNKTLRPTNTAQHTEALRLDDKRDVELLRDGVHSEGHSTN